MINPKSILYSGLPLAASLFLGGCFMPTSEKAETATPSDKPALAASVSLTWNKLPGWANSIAAGNGELYMTEIFTNILYIWGWNYGEGAYDWVSTNGTGSSTTEMDAPGILRSCYGAGCGGTVYLIGTDQRLWRSDDDGSHWTLQSSFPVSEVGANMNGALWALGSEIYPGTTSDHPIYRCVNPATAQWVKTGGAGVRIEVDPTGLPYVINSYGDIYKGNSDGTYFGHFTSKKAVDIGIGGNGSIWIIGADHVGSDGDYGIYKWDGLNWQQAPSGARRITVGSSGTPFIVTTWGEIYQGSNP
ncbi:MAG: hypothetical protein JF616_00315 [Fibrobacteres bacterium]|nr:hypothetical protein [Fibrobacterota bacterium]